MADNDAPQLSESQQQALEQFTAVTAQEIKDAIPILRRSQWNVEIAITKFFDGETSDPVAEAVAEQAAAARQQIPPPPPLPTPGSPLRAGSRNRGTISPAPRIVPQPTAVSRRPSLLISLLLFPFSLVWRLSNSFFSLFYTLFPFLARFRTATSPPSRTQTTRRSQNPRDTAARFIRLFEEEYGTETGLDFFEGGYAQALDLAKKELRFLLVVLQSDEHDDTASFNRETLINPEVVEFIKTQNIILWAGSVQDSEAYQVSAALNCAKFPFAALISRAPSPGSSQGMSVVSRIVGPTPPQTLVSKLTAAIMTHSETLERARATRAVHEAGRAIREQQNSAYELSLARDREIARARREEAERKAREEELARARADEKVLLAKNRTAWRQWRATTIPKVEPTGKDTARVSIRLRNGERVIRRFNGDANMEEVYAFVECLEYLNESATNEKTPEKPSGYTHEYGFKLVSPMPRQVYQLQSEKGGSESAVKDCLWPTASLVVEVDDDEDDEGGEDN
ncbi:unnamed protein product [Tuber melanosporum]|uniref:(Perigord truffle) hypothetical protein n=1 Tax=Tuber melanosporum (strain Mel28) TaxID=656061 RepID=D5G597_TUBMM|nr:uncharacterized protein GSTUM_00004236001 [Tuber melanosporum]CAZ79690.1 unnamed protein product [Tuber melanosporum]